VTLRNVTGKQKEQERKLQKGRRNSGAEIEGRMKEKGTMQKGGRAGKDGTE